MNKQLLIFTGVGDNEDHYLSWAFRPNPFFDRALNYYGTSDIRSTEIKKSNPEYYFQHSGMIWENFHKNFNTFNNYEYYLLVDSDLSLNPSDIEKSLEYVLKNKIDGLTWSRTTDSYGYFTPIFLQRNIDREFYYSNWIEMCFMMLSNRLTHETVKQWSTLDLSWSTGIDFVVSNVALWNNMLPFQVLNNLQFRNIPPIEKKNGREIDFITNSTTEERLSKILSLMHDTNFFKIKPEDIMTWEK